MTLGSKLSMLLIPFHKLSCIYALLRKVHIRKSQNRLCGFVMKGILKDIAYFYPRLCKKMFQ